MKIKSYFASSVEQAIQKARQELGAEAMLVTSRRAAVEARHLGAYEVVFGAPDSEESVIASPRPPSKDLSAELQVLRAQLEDIKRVLQLNNARAQGSDPDIDELYRELAMADLDSSLARQITDQVATLWQALPPAQRSAAARARTRGRCPVRPRPCGPATSPCRRRTDRPSPRPGRFRGTRSTSAPCPAGRPS